MSAKNKEANMVSGHLSEKNGHYYAVLNYKDALGKRKTISLRTAI